MNRKVLLAGLAVAVPSVALLLASLGRDPHRIRSPLIGRTAPQFSLPAVGSGGNIALSSLRGRPVVLNFWATWCIPCYAEHGVLTETARELGSNVSFIGVVYDDREEKIMQFLRENGQSYPTVRDEGGRAAIAYGVHGVPETFFLDPEGKIVAKYEGPLTRELLRSYLRRAGGRG